MIEVKINDARLQQAAEAGMDEFVKAFVDAIREAIGGELTAETMAQLNSDQITLLASFIFTSIIIYKIAIFSLQRYMKLCINPRKNLNIRLKS